MNQLSICCFSNSGLAKCFSFFLSLKAKAKSAPDDFLSFFFWSHLISVLEK